MDAVNRQIDAEYTEYYEHAEEISKLQAINKCRSDTADRCRSLAVAEVKPPLRG